MKDLFRLVEVGWLKFGLFVGGDEISTDSIEEMRESLKTANAAHRADLKAELEEFVFSKFGEDCPNCDNSGSYAGGNCEDGPEEVQCEFCWTNHNSIFNLKRDIDAFLDREYASDKRD